MQKATISFLMFDQLIQNYEQAKEAKSKNIVDVEIQNCMSSTLLLGIVLEGIVNELGHNILDTWTYNHFDRSTPQLKWKMISDKIGLQLNPGSKPLDVIDTIFKIRNRIAHLKPSALENDIILTTQNELVKDPANDYILPDEDINIYLGYGKLHDDFNIKNLNLYITEIFKFLKTLRDNNHKVLLDWLKQYEEKITVV